MSLPSIKISWLTFRALKREYFGINTLIKHFTDEQMATMEDYKYLFKVVLVGNAGVGKTCLVRRFTQGMFPPGQGATIGVDFMIKTVEVEGEKIKLQIWDTAGQERFRTITTAYYRGAMGIMLVYDITNASSFDNLTYYLKTCVDHADANAERMFLGNK